MPTVDLTDLASSISDSWFDELIPKGRVFPDFRDGLKDSTRSILWAVAKETEYGKKWAAAPTVISRVGTKYREGTDRTIHRNLMRMGGLPYPLIQTMSKTEGVISGANRVTGTLTRAHYIQVGMSELGKYVFKYMKYFDTHTGTVSTEEKISFIKTPLPLSLIIPQVNLSDGRSNSAPALNVYEVINALIVHIEKNKMTTTEDLARCINGFETGDGTTLLFTNQALYDLIERGVAKGTSLCPVTFMEEEILIKEIPYRMIGKSLIKQIKTLATTNPSAGGFESFKVVRVRPEHSEESLITIDIKINKGFDLNNVREELYDKTYLRDVIVYENFSIDPNLAKPLTKKSVRQVLDYHYDLGIELKRLEIIDKINALKVRKREAEANEKLTRPFARELIAQTITKDSKNRLVFTYLHNAKRMLREKVRNILFGEPDGDYYDVGYFVTQYANKVIEKFSQRDSNDNEEELLESLLEEMTPDDFANEDIALVFDESRRVLYDLDKRATALVTLRTFNQEMQRLTDSMDEEKIKAALIEELKSIAAPWKDSKKTKVVYARRYQQRIERNELEKKVKIHINKMNRELPVNIIVDDKLNAYKSIDILGVPGVTNPKYLFQCTTYDQLVVLNSSGTSYKIPVSDIPLNGMSIGDPERNICVVCDHYDHLLHLFVTSHGRCVLTNSSLFAFRNKKIESSLESGEKIIFHYSMPVEFYNNKISVLVKTDMNDIKKMFITDLKIKDNLKGFFTLFSGDSTTSRVTSACIIPTTHSSVDVWDHRTIRGVGFDNEKVYKRNVSRGYHLEGIPSDSFIVYDKIPHDSGRFIPDLNILFNRDMGVHNMLPIFFPVNYEEENDKCAASKVEWCDVEVSWRRGQLQLDFVPDEYQIQYFIRENSNAPTRRIFEEEA